MNLELRCVCTGGSRSRGCNKTARCQPYVEFSARGSEETERTPMPHGAWFLEVGGNAPDGPDVQLGNLLTLLPDSVDVWEQLRRLYTVRLRSFHPRFRRME